MSNELALKAQQGGLMALLGDLDSAVDTLMTEMGASRGSFLQFSGKNGDWSLNGQELDPGTQLAFNMFSVRRGVVCWADNKPIHREVTALFGPEAGPKPLAPPKEEQVKGQRWQDLIEVDIRTLDTGEQAQLGLSSRGGVIALSQLLKEFSIKGRQHVDAETGGPKTPIVEIDAEKKTGKDAEGNATTYYIPIFKIVDWASADELRAALEAPADDEVEEEEVAPPPPPKATAKAGFGSGVRGKRA